MSILKLGMLAHVAIALVVLNMSIAAGDDDVEACKSASDDDALLTCTRLITSGKVSGGLLGEIYNRRGVAFYRKNQNDRAIADYSQAIRLAPRNGTFLSNRGYALKSAGQYERALSDFSESIRIDPDPYRYNSRCRLRMRFGRELERALADCNEANRVKPNDYNILFSRGQTYIKLGDYDRAIGDFDAAAKLNTAYAYTYLYGRGLAKLKKGDTAGGNADIAAAKAIKSDVANEYAEEGF